MDPHQHQQSDRARVVVAAIFEPTLAPTCSEGVEVSDKDCARWWSSFGKATPAYSALSSIDQRVPSMVSPQQAFIQ